MNRLALACQVAVLLAAPVWAASFHGRMLLKDASNGDRRVGAAPKEGIPQGHTLKVAIQEARFGRRMAADAEVVLEVRKGATVVAGAEETLDATGYCEMLILVDDEWTGEHHVEARISSAEEKPRGRGRDGQLEREFRVIEGEPAPNVPDGLPAVLLALGAAMLVLWWKRPQPATL